MMLMLIVFSLDSTSILLTLSQGNKTFVVPLLGHVTWLRVERNITTTKLADFGVFVKKISDIWELCRSEVKRWTVVYQLTLLVRDLILLDRTFKRLVFVCFFFKQGTTWIICSTVWILCCNDTVHSLLCTDIPLITSTSNHSKSISPDLLV